MSYRDVNGFKFGVEHPDENFDHQRVFIEYDNDGFMILDSSGESLRWYSDAGRDPFLDAVENDERFGLNPLVEGFLYGGGLDEFFYSEFNREKASDYECLIVRLDRPEMLSIDEAFEDVEVVEDSIEKGTWVEFEQNKDDSEDSDQLKHPYASWTENSRKGKNELSVSSPEKDTELYKMYLEHSLDYEDEWVESVTELLKTEISNLE